MAELTDSSSSFEEEFSALRDTLQRLRKDAEAEVERLKRQLVERDFIADSSVATATDRLAMQQELTVLQQTLEAKEEALDKITEECRRLEDQVEDQNAVVDGLKHQIQQQDTALAEAQAEIDRLMQEVIGLKRLQQTSAPVAIAPTAAPAVSGTASTAAVREASRIPTAILIAGFGTLFIALSVATVLLIYLFWDRIEGLLPRFMPPLELPQLLPGGQQGPPGGESAVVPGTAAAVPRGASAVSPGSLPPGGTPATDSEPAPAESAAATPAVAIRLQRDGMRGGGQGPPMRVLPGGVFQMGKSSLGSDDFAPVRTVRVAAFLIGAYEISFAEYDRFAQATGRASPTDYGWGRGNRPVVGVSWQDASAYAEWLSAQTNRRYRLPTEAEWEYAARAGSTSPFWWGFDLEANRAVCFECGSRWDNVSTAPVGSFAANPFGLYDSAGNAMEWVVDCYHPNYQGAPTDGSARIDANCGMRVARGGSFSQPAASMRVYVRARFFPDTRLNMLGFRIARDA